MNIKNELQKGIILQQKGKLNDAKKIYQKILKFNPNIAEVHHNLAILLKSLNQLEDAEKYFYKSILLKPGFVISHYQMGNTKFKLNKFDESEVFYKKAISLKPNFLEAYINLGRSQRELNKLDDAENNLRKAQKINPNNPDVNALLGLILFDKGRLANDLKSKNSNQLDEAKKILLTSIKEHPYHAFSHLNLGLIQHETGELDKAKSSYEKSLEFDPNSYYAKYNLSILLTQLKLLELIKPKDNKKIKSTLNSLKKFKKIPFITSRKINIDLIKLLYYLESTDLDNTKWGPLFGNGKTSDYSLLEKNYLPLNELKFDLINIIKTETSANVFIADSFFNILSKGGGSIAHHHVDSFDVTHNLINQKYSLTYYLSIGDQNCDEPGVFKLYEPDEEILPYEGMIMIIPANRKHSAFYMGKKDRVMIGVNFYLY